MNELETRRKAPLSEVRVTDGMAALGLGWWEANRSPSGRFPLAQDALPLPLTLLVSSSYLVTVVRVTPVRFTFAITHWSGTTCPDIVPLIVFADTLRERRRTLYDDLGFVSFSGTPSYHFISAIHANAKSEDYRRLILPLSNVHLSVDQLLVLAEPQERGIHAAR